MSIFRATFLGTGTSVGVPMIGCACPVCRGLDKRNVRSRSGLYLQTDEHAYLIDTSVDLRMQAISNHITQVEALLYTHSHADHIFGLDDVRRFNTLQGNAIIPLYACAETLAEIRRTFNYISDTAKDGLFRALIQFKPFGEQPFDLMGTKVTPVTVQHNGVTHGFRIDYANRSLGYIPDCKYISPSELSKLQGLDVLILDALRFRPHPTHLHIAATLELIRSIAPKRAFLTHICHEVDHGLLQSILPQTVFVAHDSLVIDI